MAPPSLDKCFQGSSDQCLVERDYEAILTDQDGKITARRTHEDRACYPASPQCPEEITISLDDAAKALGQLGQGSDLRTPLRQHPLWDLQCPPSLIIGDKARLLELLQAYFDNSQCRTESTDSAHDCWGERDRIEESLRRYDWPNINVAETVFAFISERHGDEQHVSQTEIPDLTEISSEKAWVKYFAGKLQEMLEKDNAPFSTFKTTMRESMTIRSMVINFAYAYSTSPNFDPHSENTQSLKDTFYKIYEDLELDMRDSPYLRKKSYLQYGAWLGDIRAYHKAKGLVEKFLSNESNGEEEKINLQGAVFALLRFNVTHNPSLAQPINQLIQRVQQSEIVPQYIKDKTAES